MVASSRGGTSQQTGVLGGQIRIHLSFRASHKLSKRNADSKVQDIEADTCKTICIYLELSVVVEHLPMVCLVHGCSPGADTVG